MGYFSNGTEAMMYNEPLKIEIFCKHCGTYLKGEWGQTITKGVEIAVDTWPHCCSDKEDKEIGI